MACHAGFFYDNLDSSLAPVIENALAKLRDAGCVLVDADIPDIDKLYLSATIPTTYYETLQDTSRYLQESGEHITMQEFAAQIGSPDVKTYYETLVIGPGAPTRAAYEVAMRNRPALQAAYRNYFRSHNVVAVDIPTTVLPARPIGEDTQIDLNGKKLSTFNTYLRNTRTITTAGIPGMSLPVGLTAAGLPVGLEFDAPHGSDRKLLSLGLTACRMADFANWPHSFSTAEEASFRTQPPWHWLYSPFGQQNSRCQTMHHINEP